MLYFLFTLTGVESHNSLLLLIRQKMSCYQKNAKSKMPENVLMKANEPIFTNAKRGDSFQIINKPKQSNP